MHETPTAPLRMFHVGSYNPRRRVNTAAFAQFKAGVKVKGILVPVLVRRVENGPTPLEIIAGQRRYLAAKEEFGEDYQLPYRLKQMSDSEAIEAATVENTEREDMSAVEEAEAAAMILARCKGDRAEAARRMGWSPATLDNRLKLMACSDKVREKLAAEEIALGLAEMLAGLTHTKQNELLNDFFASGKIPSVEECKAQILAYTKSLESACFDKTQCGTCPHNSAQQRAMFGNIDEGHCLNAPCYDNKTEAVLQAKLVELKDDFPRVEIARAGDNFRVIKLTAEAVGEVQAQACRSCANFGAAVSALPNKIGQVAKNLCWDTECNAQKAFAHQKALADAAEADKTTGDGEQAGGTDENGSAPASGTSSATKSTARDAKKAKKKPNPVSTKKAPVATVVLSPVVKEFRDKLYRGVLYKELGTHPERNRQFVLALVYADCGSYFKGAGVQASLVKAGLVSADQPRDIATAMATALALPADRVANFLPNLGATAIESLSSAELRSLCIQCAPDWKQYFRLDSEAGRQFLGKLTKSEIAHLCDELGISAAMGETFRSISAGLKDKFIEHVTSVKDFDYVGKIPPVLLPEAEK